MNADSLTAEKVIIYADDNLESDNDQHGHHRHSVLDAHKHATDRSL